MQIIYDGKTHPHDTLVAKNHFFYDPVFLRNEVKSRFLVKNNTTQITL